MRQIPNVGSGLDDSGFVAGTVAFPARLGDFLYIKALRQDVQMVA